MKQVFLHIRPRYDPQSFKEQIKVMQNFEDYWKRRNIPRRLVTLNPQKYYEKCYTGSFPLKFTTSCVYLCQPKK